MKLKYLHNIISYLLLIIGICILSWIIYARFIRERLPKEIPFELTEIKFYILLFICIAYLIIVKNLIKPNKPNDIITFILKYLYLPLTALDETLKTNKYFNVYYHKAIPILIEKIDTLSFKALKRIYIMFQIIPRLFLIVFLSIDTFYIHKIELFYKIILLGLLPLLHRYLKYSFKVIKDHVATRLSEKYAFVWVLDINYTEVTWESNPEHIYHDTHQSVKSFIDIQFDFLTNYGKTIYSGDCFVKEDLYQDFAKRHNKTKLSNEDHQILDKEFNTGLINITKLALKLNEYSRIESLTYIRILRIIIFGTYFICWSYILLVSFHTLDDDMLLTLLLLLLLDIYTPNMEPFAQTPL